MSVNFTFAQFSRLMSQLADSWQSQNTEAALNCFTKDAVYMEPPNIQLYIGHEQLRPYFAALKPGTYLTLHNLCFNQTSQVGMAEYTFGMEGKELADVGVIVVQLEAGKIAKWREYQRKGPANFAKFTAHEGKAFEWHIGNYP